MNPARKGMLDRLLGALGNQDAQARTEARTELNAMKGERTRITALIGECNGDYTDAWQEAKLALMRGRDELDEEISRVEAALISGDTRELSDDRPLRYKGMITDAISAVENAIARLRYSSDISDLRSVIEELRAAGVEVPSDIEQILDTPMDGPTAYGFTNIAYVRGYLNSALERLQQQAGKSSGRRLRRKSDVGQRLDEIEKLIASGNIQGFDAFENLEEELREIGDEAGDAYYHRVEALIQRLDELCVSRWKSVGAHALYK